MWGQRLSAALATPSTLTQHTSPHHKHTMFFTKSTLFAFVATAFAVGANAATATYYLPSGAFGACGTQHQNFELVAALSPPEYAAGANCGRRIRVSYQGRSVDVTVVDLCPGCQSGHIDLSQGAFQQLADLGLGVLNGVEYHYL
ncbi:RlpA-like double-psi beta-barrel-protein domain-containing protein-containing protein [Earliella scabrosa]|nr:RlpA-like double-psi beta-barrel-protein domain-containing protein-containing protein [Earliella scabrosa]